MAFTGTNIRIEIDTNKDLSGGSDPFIRYRRRSGSGQWTAVINGTKLYYDTATGDLNAGGVWEFQGVVTLDGKVLKTEIVNQLIQTPIKPT